MITEIYESGLIDVIRKAYYIDRTGPCVIRTGRRGEQYKVLGYNQIVPSLEMACRIEKAFMLHELRRGKVQGWFGMYARTYWSWPKLPKYNDCGQIICSSTKKALPRFDGVCKVESQGSKCLYLKTWMNGNYRLWASASMQDIAIELRKCH